MTAIVGITCVDGLVIGADSAVSFEAGGYRTVEQPAEKIKIIDNKLILAGTGQVGLGQRFTSIVEELWGDGKLNGSQFAVAKQLSAACIKDMRETFASTGQYGALFGFPKGDKHYLCEFAIRDFQPEFKDSTMWYCSMGSGQMIIDPFLGFVRSVFWGENTRPNLAEGIFVVKWCLQHAIEVNPGGVNSPIKIAVMENDDRGKPLARMLSEGELETHKENIHAIRKYIYEFKQKLNPDGAQDVPIPDN